MTRTPRRNGRAAVKAASELATLQQQAEQARAALARLHRNVVEA